MFGVSTRNSSILSALAPDKSYLRIARSPDPPSCGNARQPDIMHVCNLYFRYYAPPGESATADAPINGQVGIGATSIELPAAGIAWPSALGNFGRCIREWRPERRNACRARGRTCVTRAVDAQSR